MLNENAKHYFIQSLVFLFPILTATIKSAGGVILFTFVLAGCFKGWPAWKKIESWERKVLVGFLIFCALVSISLLATQNIEGGISKFERYLYFVLFVPAYLFVRHLGVETGRSLLFGAVAGSFVMLFQAVYQTSVLGNAYAIGAYHKIIFGDTAMLVAVIVGLGLLTVRWKWWQYIVGFIAIFSGITASILSGTRGAWIFLPISIVATLYLYRNDMNKKKWGLVFLSILFVVGIGFVSAPSIVVERYQASVQDIDRHFSNSIYWTSLGIRINLWRDSLSIWEDTPIFGTGIGDFKGEIERRMADKTAFSYVAFGHAHSIYFDALATTGILGLAGLLFFMLLRPLRYYMFWWGRAENSSQQFYLSGGILVVIGFSVFGLTEGWLSRSSMVIQYLMYTLVFMSSFAINKSNNSVKGDSVQLKQE